MPLANAININGQPAFLVVSRHFPADHTMSSSDFSVFSKTDRSWAETVLSEHGLEFTPDGQLVRWQPGNKQHPRNWPIHRRVFDICVIFFLDLFLYVLVCAI